MSERIFRVHLEPAEVPTGWANPVDVDANHAATGPDGTLFLSKRTAMPAGVDLKTGQQRIEVANRLVLVLRGGHRPMWRWVQDIEAPPPPEEPGWVPAPREESGGERS